MRLHSETSRRPRQLGPALTMAAALAVTLAACSSPASPATHAKPQAPVAAAAPATAASSPAPASAASPLTGKWAGHYGGSFQGTFSLHWHQSGSKLKGTIQLSDPGTSLPINGSVSGSTIRFGTVGSYGITYSGTVSGNSMSGTYQVANGQGGGHWSANKS